MRLTAFRFTRFQFARDRVIGDCQVRADEVNVAALELFRRRRQCRARVSPRAGFWPLPAQDEITRCFQDEVWPSLLGQSPIGLVHRVARPRGGNQRAFSLPFEESAETGLRTSPRSNWDCRCIDCWAVGAIACLRFGARFSFERRRVRRILWGSEIDWLRGFQDQGRPFRLRARSASP